MRPTTYRQHIQPCPTALNGLRARNDLLDLYNHCDIEEASASVSHQTHLKHLLNWGFSVDAAATDHWVLTPPDSNSKLHLYGIQELARYTGHLQWQRNQHRPEPSSANGNDNSDRKDPI